MQSFCFLSEHYDNQLNVQSFYWSFITQAWLSDSLSTWLNFQSLSSSMGLISHGSTLGLFIHMAGVSNITSPILSHVIAINLGVFLKSPAQITQTCLSVREFQAFRGFLPGTRDKAQPNSLLHWICISTIPSLYLLGILSALDKEVG